MTQFRQAAYRSQHILTTKERYDNLAFKLGGNLSYQSFQKIERILTINLAADSKETTSSRLEKLSDRIINDTRLKKIADILTEADSDTIEAIWGVVLDGDSELAKEVEHFKDTREVNSLLIKMLGSIATPFSAKITHSVLSDLNQYSPGLLAKKENTDRLGLLKEKLRLIKKARQDGQLTILQETLIIKNLLNSPEFFPVNKGAYYDTLRMAKENFITASSGFVSYGEKFVDRVRRSFVQLFDGDFEKSKKIFMKAERKHLQAYYNKSEINNYIENVLECELFINHVKEDLDKLKAAIKLSVGNDNSSFVQLKSDPTFQLRLGILGIDMEEYRATYIEKYVKSDSKSASSSSSSASCSLTASISVPIDPLISSEILIATGASSPRRSYDKKSPANITAISLSELFSSSSIKDHNEKGMNINGEELSSNILSTR